MSESDQIAAIIRSWPVLPEHTADDGAPCAWAGIGSQAGKCPDRCKSLEPAVQAELSK